MILLGFGSSTRRGATGWTDPVPPRAVLAVCQPDQTIDGASPSGGADDVFHDAALEHFMRRHLDPLLARRCPMAPALDGPGGRAFLRRNARMYRTHRPSLAAGFVSGKVGSEMSSGSRAMARICLAGLRGDDPREGVPSCPVVVYREDGVEPYHDLATAYHQMRRLYAVTKDPALVAPGKALAMIGTPRDEVRDSLKYARDGSRWAPWLDAMIATVALAT